MRSSTQSSILYKKVRTDAAAAICALSEGNDLKEALVLRPWGSSVHDEPIPGDPLPGQPGGPEVGCYAPEPHGWGWNSSASSSSSRHLAGPANKATVLDMLLKDATDKPKGGSGGVNNDKDKQIKANSEDEDSPAKTNSNRGGGMKLNFKGKFGKRTLSQSPTPKSPNTTSGITTTVAKTDKPQGKGGKVKGATTVLLECVYSFAKANEVIFIILYISICFHFFSGSV